MTNKVPLSVVILTYNEEKNIEQCLKSLQEWASEIFIVDSYSSDKTIDIAKKYTDKIYQHQFEGYAKQRNWALEHLPFSNEWVLFLDADERISEELKEEIKNLLMAGVPETVTGFYIKRRFIFMKKWIKHGGYYPVWLLRLFRHKVTRCQERGVDEHFVTQGKTLRLKNDIIHEDHKGISSWIERHNKYASLEANEQINFRIKNKEIAKYSKIDQKRWLKRYIWNHLPLLVRPFLYFFYCYFLKGGFLDGKSGLIYHFLRNLWYPFLVDVKILEIQKHRKQKKDARK